MDTILLTHEQMMIWLGTFIWPFFRVGAMLMSMPIFGGRTMPMNVRLYFSLMITVGVMSAIPDAPYIDPLSPTAFAVTLQQISIGLLIGTMMRLTFEIFSVAGHIVSMQTGLGFAMLADPQTGVSTPSLSRLLSYGVGLTFLAMNGHLVMLDIIVDSFTTMPIGESFPKDHYKSLVLFGAELYRGAVVMTLPLIASLLIVNITFGVLGRVAPTLNIMAVGFPMTLNFGLVLFAIGMASVLSHIPHYFENVFQLMSQKLVMPG